MIYVVFSSEYDRINDILHRRSMTNKLFQQTFQEQFHTVLPRS